MLLYYEFAVIQQRNEKRRVWNMKKKWIASLLAASLLASLMVMPAWAAVEQTVTPREKTITAKAKT